MRHGGVRENSGGRRAGAGRPANAEAAVAAVVRGPRWYVLETAPRGELAAIHALITAGFEVMLPLYQPAKGAVLEPAFPRYVLVRFDLAWPKWRRIADAERGWRLLGRDAEHPQAISDAAMVKLMREYGPDGRALTWQPPPPRDRLGAGVRVTVDDGPFQGCLGVVVEDRGATLVVMVDVFGRGTRCEVPVSAVAVVVA